MPSTVPFSSLIAELRKNFEAGKTRSLDVRQKQLAQLNALIEENTDEICDAVYKDLRRSKAEMVCLELISIKNEIKTALENFKTWAQPQHVSRTLLHMTNSAYIVKDPLGVVLILSAWNYPVYLLLAPLVGAIAAGNCVVLKPSEVSENTATLLAQLIPKYLDSEIVKVVQGGIPETTAILKERFDHIFFTGSTNVGKVILRAAAEHLTPVTLELGGKSPAIVDEDCDPTIAARRIAWGSFMSSGQTCLAPDYVLCHKSVKDAFLEGVKESVREFYTDDPQTAVDYARMVNKKQFDRVMKLFKGTKGAVKLGGKRFDANDLYIEPTVVELTTEQAENDSLMQEELFAPVMPIIVFEDVEMALDFIRKRPKPLAMYLFTRNQKLIDHTLSTTSCGGLTINDVILHISLDTLPFGGVGCSGMGRYHGKFSFDTFVHEKSVLHRPVGMEKMLFMRYPPYDDRKFYWAQKAMSLRDMKSLCSIM